MREVRAAITFLAEIVLMKSSIFQSKGSKAKPYQIKQVRTILVKYRLGEYDVD